MVLLTEFRPQLMEIKAMSFLKKQQERLISCTAVMLLNGLKTERRLIFLTLITRGRKPVKFVLHQNSQVTFDQIQEKADHKLQMSIYRLHPRFQSRQEVKTHDNRVGALPCC